MNTKDKILDKALEMFNERGIEYVGLRELAAVLGIRVGNISYYFPTKDDLVYQLSQEFTRSNSEIVVAQNAITIHGFLDMLLQVFENHYRFRCLLRSFVHIMTQNKLVSSSYGKTRQTRRSAIASNIHGLAEARYLKTESKEQIDALVSAIELVSRYWISDAAVFARNLSKKQQVEHYFNIVVSIVDPHASLKAKKEIRSFCDKISN